MGVDSGNGTPLSTIGLVMPSSFPSKLYEDVHARVTPKVQEQKEDWFRYAGAWNALAYRFLACTDHHRLFTDSLRRAGTAPPQPERYIQERELFSFFVAGDSTLDCLFYALFVIGKRLVPGEFSLVNKRNPGQDKPGKERPIYLTDVRKGFIAAFPGEPLTGMLTSMEDDDDYQKWKEIRNLLTHRVIPPRTIQIAVGAPTESATAFWKFAPFSAMPDSTPINADFTESRLRWLTGTLCKTLEAADTFADKHL